MKALIVDGGQAVRSMVGYMLDAGGFEVKHAEDTHAVRVLLDEGFEPDVVITCQLSRAVADVTALRSLKAHSAMKRVPVILMAEKEDLKRQMEWKEAGVTCWLTWPVTPVQLLEMVQIVLFDRTEEKNSRRHGLLLK